MKNNGDGTYTKKIKANTPSAYHEPEWGNTDLKWAFLQCCKALSSSYKTRWDDSFIGLHGICGFHTEAEANAGGLTGYKFAYYLTDGNENILNAWKMATQETQSIGYEGAIYRAQIRTDQMQLIDYGSEHIDDMYYDYGVSGSTLEHFLYTKRPCLEEG